MKEAEKSPVTSGTRVGWKSCFLNRRRGRVGLGDKEMSDAEHSVSDDSSLVLPLAVHFRYR